MLNIGPQELLVILIIALLVVGPQRLPELSRQIGRGLREFRKIQDDVKDMVKLDLDTSEPPARQAGSPTAPGVHRTSRPTPSASATQEGSEGTAPTSMTGSDGTPSPGRSPDTSAAD